MVLYHRLQAERKRLDREKAWVKEVIAKAKSKQTKQKTKWFKMPKSKWFRWLIRSALYPTLLFGSIYCYHIAKQAFETEDFAGSQALKWATKEMKRVKKQLPTEPELTVLGFTVPNLYVRCKNSVARDGSTF